MTRFVFLLAALFLALPALAQDESDGETRSRFTRFVESQLSSENRQIRLNGIDGALSSEATIREITVADRQGVWLRIENARIVWTRTALLRGRLEIDRLAADRIEVMRKPLPEEGLEAPAPEAGGFSVPELPVSVRLEQLEVPQVHFGPSVFGLESVLSVNGSFLLAEGALEASLAVERLDGPGGQLELDVAYANETQEFRLDLDLSEPEDGVLANLLGIQGRPAVDLTLAGSGPISDLTVELALDADGERVLAGEAGLEQTGAGLEVAVDVGGAIERLVAPAFRDFFGESTALTAEAILREGGGLTVETVSVDSGALRLQASAETSEDNFLRRLRLEASIASRDGSSVVLPVAGGQTQVNQARLSVDYGAQASNRWSGALNVDGLSTATLDARNVDIDFGGMTRNLDRPDERQLTFRASGGVSGISASDPAVQSALGDGIDLAVEGAWQAGGPMRLAEARLSAEALSLELAGAIAEATFDGTIAVVAQSIAPFSALAERDLAGSIDLDAEGMVSPLSGGFNLTFDGSGEGLEIGEPAVDRLLRTTVRLSGRLARTEQGFEADAFTVENEQFSINADGRYASDTQNLALDIGLSDLALVSDRVSGPLSLTARTEGDGQTVDLVLEGSIPSGQLAGRSLSEARFGFAGVLVNVDPQAGQPYGEGVQGTLSANAFLGGEAVTLDADIYATPERRTLDNLDFRAGGAILTGNIAQDENGLLTGSANLDAWSISTLAALALQEAAGAAELAVELSVEDGRQNATLSGSLSDVVVAETRIGQARVDAKIADLFGVPKVEGSITASSMEAGGVVVETLTAEATRQDALTKFSAEASLDRGTEIALSGSLEETARGLRVALDDLNLMQGQTAARLTEPATLVVDGRTITIDTFALDVAGGSVRADGVLADTLDLEVEITELPLSIANTVMPDLDAAGMVDGTATVTGTRDAPEIDFEMTGRNLTAAPLRQRGLPAVNMSAAGQTTGERVEIVARLTAPGGIAVDAKGSIPLDDGQMDLDVKLTDLPLRTIDSLAGGRGLRGSVSATAQLGGTIAQPEVRFEIDGNAISADPLAEFGVQPLTVAAEGRFAENTVILDSAVAENGQGLLISASGRVPVSGSGLDVNVQGNAPLSLANAALAERGAAVQGAAEFSVAVSGSVADPQFNGMVSTSNAVVIDPESNIRLEGISVLASISGRQVIINTFRANLSSGGSFTIGGSVSLDAAAGFPADIDMVLDRVRYADGDFLIVTASGNLSVTGPLLRDPVISGTVDVANAEIGIPEGLGDGSTLTDVTHVAPPPDVRATLERAELTPAGEPPTPTARPSLLRLDVTVNAPNQIFIRGRGLDAEVGGSIRLTGPVTDVEPVGTFELIRGRLSILGRRIVFDEGTVTLIGDLDPFVNLRATSQSGDTTIVITVSGRASDIDIDFSSQPALPEDEVIARLIFDRSISELSPFQIAQLAAAVAELSGGQTTGLLGQLRQSTGLDDLDVVVDEDGNAVVRAGRYVRDNVYLGVQAGSGGSSEVTIDLGITENLKARGAAGADGDTSLGLFYERDY